MSKGRLEYNRISPSHGHILYYLMTTYNIYLAISLQNTFTLI